MDRPSRKTKTVNYCESKGFDDDEDFAPPSKKSKEEQKHWSSRPAVPEPDRQSSQGQRSRKPLEEKLLERDLEAAITLSMLNDADGETPRSPAGRGAAAEPPGGEPGPPSLLRSNCSVDGDVLDLDRITAESPARKQRKAEERKRKDEDDDYKPRLTPGSESDEDFSAADESDDEEFTVKKSSRAKKTEEKKKKEKPRTSPAAPRAKRPAKPARSGPAVSTATVKPPTAKPALSRSASAAAPRPPASGSPAGGRVPRWNPPAPAGRGPGPGPGSSQRPAARSPGQGLRLGLSRLVRVKPLHPGVASH